MIKKTMAILMKRVIEDSIGKNEVEKMCKVLLQCSPKVIQKNVILTDTESTAGMVSHLWVLKRKHGKIFNVRFQDEKYSIISSGIGYPSALIVMDILFKTDVKKVIRIGFCGSLHDKIKVGDFFLPRVIRTLNGKPISVSSDSIKCLLSKEDIPFGDGVLFSNDIIVKNRSLIKCKADCVDMESYYVAKFCKENSIDVEFLFIVSDLVPE